MSHRKQWMIAYYLLFAMFVLTAALNMLRVSAGFFTNHAADLVVPAWLYIASRGLHSRSGRTTLIQRTIGSTAGIAALSIFAASALTEISQHYWPRGFFPGRFDLLDIVAYAAGLGACYVADKLWGDEARISAHGNSQPTE